MSSLKQVKPELYDNTLAQLIRQQDILDVLERMESGKTNVDDANLMRLHLMELYTLLDQYQNNNI